MSGVLLDQAVDLIRAATGGGGLNRDAATRWYQLLQQAKGTDAEQIGQMGEALLVAARDDLERAWVQGLLRGGPEQAMAHQARTERTQAAARGDAEDEPAAPDDGIDWAKVAREAQTMVDLNRSATEAWQSSRKGVKGEDG